LDKNGKIFENEVYNLFGKENQEVKNFFRDNFFSLFRGWILLTEQEIYTIQYGEQSGGIPDDLAFDVKKRTLWVFEYKSELSIKQINQALTYVNALKDPANLYHFWRERLRKYGWEVEDIEKVKAICISPEFDKYQKGAENEQIILVKITKYRNGTYSSVRLESKYFEFPSDEKIKIETSCQQLGTNEWVKEKLKEIDGLVSRYTSWKEKLWNGNFVVYKRENGDWLLLIRIGRKEFKVWFEDNEITKKLDYCEEYWVKNLHREIICKKEQSYQNCYNLLTDYLEQIKKQ
jgi:hypothetical protein